jgi:hypothetical protein
MSIQKFLLLFVPSIIFFNSTQAQKFRERSLRDTYPEKIIYGKCTELEVCEPFNTDTGFFVKNYPIVLSYPKIELGIENGVDCEPGDTLGRIIMTVYEKRYCIDSLMEFQSDYTGAYNLLYAFSVLNKKEEYVILYLFDGHQMGSMAQGIYLIFNRSKFYANYVENLNHRSSKVRIIKKKTGVFLKSKNIDKVK